MVAEAVHGDGHGLLGEHVHQLDAPGAHHVIGDQGDVRVLGTDLVERLEVVVATVPRLNHTHASAVVHVESGVIADRPVGEPRERTQRTRTQRVREVHVRRRGEHGGEQPAHLLRQFLRRAEDDLGAGTGGSQSHAQHIGQ